jgi:hypothetical protein
MIREEGHAPAVLKSSQLILPATSSAPRRSWPLPTSMAMTRLVSVLDEAAWRSACGMREFDSSRSLW